MRQPLLRDGFAADLTHAIVNGVLLDLPLALVEPLPRYIDRLMMPLGPPRTVRWNFDDTPSSNPVGGA